MNATPKTHDLVRLDTLLRGAKPAWESTVEDLRFLTRAAVAFRYPGESADHEDAVALCMRLREALRRVLEDDGEEASG